MSVVSYIVIALAMGIFNMLLFRRCGEATPIRLSAGLIVALAVAAVHTLLFYGGSLLGGLLQLSSPDDAHMYDDFNAYIFLGIVLAVDIKLLAPYLRREPRLPLFRLDSGGAVLAMAVATGINTLLVGIGTGFAKHGPSLHKALWPMLVACLLLGYLGLMFGRRKVQVRPRRWAVTACVLLLATAIAAVVNAS